MQADDGVLMVCSNLITIALGSVLEVTTLMIFGNNKVKLVNISSCTHSLTNLLTKQ